MPPAHGASRSGAGDGFDLSTGAHQRVAPFCEQCGALLTVSEVAPSGSIDCVHCGWHGMLPDVWSGDGSTGGAPLDGWSIGVSSTRQVKHDTVYVLNASGEEGADVRPDIDVECIKEGCAGKKAYYRTAQLRSVDEGATIFYECMTCGWKWSLNN